jgi:hypothetical protein
MSRLKSSLTGLGLLILAATLVGAAARQPAGLAATHPSPVTGAQYAASSPPDTEWAMAAHIGW